jgi:hypothetical protein
MKRKTLLGVLVFVFLTQAGFLGQIKQEQPSHPRSLSPEETLRVILQAYIDDDMETIMAYYPKDSSIDFKFRLERFRRSIERRMTEEMHVEKIIEIKPSVVKTEGDDKVARIKATIAVTEEFSPFVQKTAGGDYVVSYTWFLRQIKGTGPWYYDGGGF